jgi:hypothetical protein
MLGDENCGRPTRSVESCNDQIQTFISCIEEKGKGSKGTLLNADHAWWGGKSVPACELEPWF